MIPYQRPRQNTFAHKRVFNVAITDGLADTNPVRAVRMLRENNARVRFLTEDEEPRLHEEIGDRR